MSERRAILVVEDDLDISEAVAAVLEERGHNVILAANGEEALRVLRTLPEPPRLILLDLMMPVMDGWQFRAAQKADPALANIPVVVLSARVDVRETAQAMGASFWLKKPIDMADLLAVAAGNEG